jgi:hypothetical protein
VTLTNNNLTLNINPLRLSSAVAQKRESGQGYLRSLHASSVIVFETSGAVRSAAR